jgi:hypothetical protein
VRRRAARTSIKVWIRRYGLAYVVLFFVHGQLWREREGVGSQDDGHDRIRRKEDSFTGGRQAVLCTLWVL